MRGHGRGFSTSRLVIFGYVLVILSGAALLSLPVSLREGARVSLLDTLFTAASATCITGLTVNSIADTYSGFGQAVILLLIQIGGLGFMTVYSALILFIGKRFTLEGRVSLRDSFAQIDIGEVKGLLFKIIKITFTAEIVGAAVLTAAFTKYYNFGAALWQGLFHSVSAFCNAGFDIASVGSGSMTAFNDNPLILLTLSFLIIAGGLGFIVYSDIGNFKVRRRFSMHSKIVLLVSAVLLTLGTVVIFTAEHDNPATLGSMSFWHKAVNAFFLSATSRTAGFANVDITGLSRTSMAMFQLLMFIGASPASTGGGLKTTTLFVLITAVSSVILRRKHTVVGYREIGQETLAKAISVFMLSAVIFLISFFILAVSEPQLTDRQIVFEQISAYATVGFTLDATATLSAAGKIVIMLNMFFGRLGALTVLLSFSKGREGRDNGIKYPDANIKV